MKKLSIPFVTLLITILVYSIMLFGYTHKTFVSKEVFDLIVQRLDRIESKIDFLIRGEN